MSDEDLNAKKLKKLEHYSNQPANDFIQFDVFESTGEKFAVTTTELMRGSDVRVLIKPDVEKEFVIDALEDVIEWIKSEQPDPDRPRILEEMKEKIKTGPPDKAPF